MSGEHGVHEVLAFSALTDKEEPHPKSSQASIPNTRAMELEWVSRSSLWSAGAGGSPGLRKD